MTKAQRKKAIARRRLLIAFCIILLIAVIGLIAFAVKSVFSGGKKENTSSAQSTVESNVVSNTSSKEPEVSYPATGVNGLDANYSQLLLVNADNPLPENYNYEGNLTEMPTKYINGILKHIDKDVWKYLQPMMDAAWADGVELKVRSPYRSYETQKELFELQVKKWPSLSREEAEAKAATVVTRPGTSEHNTGFCADFNKTEDEFETYPAFTWLKEHAADYGFILRYPKEKQDITGITYESWHWRFVGINTAKEINRLNMCLEEYVKYINK